MKPLCGCHGEPMYWYRDRRRGRNGGRWGCAVKARASAREVMRRRRATAEGRARSRAADAKYKAVPENRERARLRSLAWRAANPARCREQGRVKRARKRGVGSDGHTRADVWDWWGDRCHLCGVRLDPSDWHEDHVVPLSRGGPDTLDNCRPSCPPCNLRKGSMTLDEYKAVLA